MLLNELDTKYSEANRITAQALRDYAEESNKAMIDYDGEGSMDYELFLTVADAIEAGDVDTVAREINDADTEPRDFMMDLLLDKHPEMAKAVSMKVSGTLQSIFGMTGRMPAQEESVQEAKGKYEFGPPTGKETYPGGYEHDARMITHIISDLSPRIKDDQLMLDVQDAINRIEANGATKADIALVMDVYKDIVAQGLDKPYKDAIGKFDQNYDPNDPDNNDLDEGRVKSWVMGMEEDAYDMTREEFIAKHGESHVDIWDKVHSGEDEYEPEPDFESVQEGVKRNILYRDIGIMLAKGHDIKRIKKRYKDIDDAHPGHIEKIVQALKDRNEIPKKKIDEAMASKEEILALNQKWNTGKYYGGNGDYLLDGYCKYMLDSGIPWDACEKNEVNKYAEKYGDLGDFDMGTVEDNPDFPITNEFHNDLFRVFKGMPDEDETEEMCDILDQIGESKKVKEGRMGFKDLEQFGAEMASKIDMEARRRGSADMEPGDADQLRYKIAKEMGLVKEGTEMGKIGDVYIKQFAGGKDKGLSVQLTSDKGGYVQMTKDEAKQIAERLLKWATSDSMAYPGDYE